MEKQTIAAYPRWRSRTAVSAYQSVLVALAAADNAALLLNEHLVAAAAAVARDQLADKGRVLPGRAIEEAPQLAGLILGCWTSSAPPTRQPGAWSSRRSAEPRGWLGLRPLGEPARRPCQRRREPGGRPDKEGDG
jgi:hypothetical protein